MLLIKGYMIIMNINKNVYFRKLIMLLAVSFLGMSFLVGCSDSLSGKRFYYIDSEGNVDKEMYVDFTEEDCWIYINGKLYDRAEYKILDVSYIVLNSLFNSNSAVMNYNKSKRTISGSYGRFKKVEVPQKVSVDDRENDKQIKENNYLYLDSSVPINEEDYNGEIIWTKFKNTKSGYIFGVEDYSSHKLYAEEQWKFRRLIEKLEAISEYTDVEVVFFEEEEMGYTLDVLSRKYLINNDREDESYTPYLCLFELIHSDGTIDYSVYGNNKIYSVICPVSMQSLFGELEEKHNLSIDFATLLIDYIYSLPYDMRCKGSNELTIKSLADMASAHYSSRFNIYGFDTSYKMLSEDIVRIYLEDYEQFYWYDVDINTGIGENCAKEYVDLKSVKELFSTARSGIGK